MSFNRAARFPTSEQTNAPGKKKAPTYEFADKQKGPKDIGSDHEDEVRSELSVEDEDTARTLPLRKPTRPKTTAPGESTSRDEKKEKQKEKDTTISEPLSYLLLKPAYDAGMATIVTDEAATFVPTGHMLFAILNGMHLCTAENIYVYRANPKYHVILSRLYYAVIFFVQILRCKRIAGIATHKEKNFLSDFEDDYPLESLPIAGPLVTHFNNLTAFKHDDPKYKWISPTIVYNNDSRMKKVPSIVCLLSMIKQMKKTPITPDTRREDRDASTAPYINDDEIWTPFYIHEGTPPARHIFGGAIYEANREIVTGYASHLVLPGLAFPPEMTPETIKNRRTHLIRMKFPDDGTLDTSSPARLLCMDDDMEWFRHCVSVALTESTFFLGSTNLSQINVTGTPSTLVMTKAEDLAHVPAHFEWYYGPTTLKVTAKTQYGGILPDDFALGTFNNFHHTYPSNAPYGLENLGSTRPNNAGAYHPWYLEPDRVETGKAKLMSSELESVIRLKMFVAKGIENRPKA